MNRRINLLARTGEDMDWHIRHCLTLSSWAFPDDAIIVDFGTGGGFPAIPLAVRFPASHVVAVDATEKKVMAVRSMARRAGIENITAWAGRAEEWPGTAHYAVSRATAPLSSLWEWTVRVLQPREVSPGDWRCGLLCLKGGVLEAEIAEQQRQWPESVVETHDLRELAGTDFTGKYIVHVTPA